MTSRAALPWLVAITFTVVAATACGDDDDGTGGGSTTMGTGGTGTGTGTGTATGTGGTSAGGGDEGGAGGSMMTCDDLACDQCSACAEADPCMAESATCDGNAVCGDYGSCVNGCGSDVACIDGCKMQHADGVADFEALVGCICTTCSTSCGANPLCPPMM